MAPQVVGCNGALMGMLPWLFGAFLADFRATRWSWLRLPLAVAAILLHLVIAILQVSVLLPCREVVVGCCHVVSEGLTGWWDYNSGVFRHSRLTGAGPVQGCTPSLERWLCSDKR